MTTSYIKAILILPGTALVYVPALVLWFAGNTRYAAEFPPTSALTWLIGVGLAAAGLILMNWTMRLYIRKGGGGTPAPWDPIPNFVVAGPYRYVRNPMLIGVILFLGAEAVLLQSIPVFGWMAVFLVINTLYFRFSEEPELLKRFGEDYADYLRHVPRWIPRLTPYRRSGDDSGQSPA